MSASVLSQNAIIEQIENYIPHWSFQDGALVRLYRTHNWKATMMVVGTIGHMAEAAWHHPELIVTYAAVEVRLNTQDAGGVTMKDVELARKIEDVICWQPALDNGALEGTPDGPSAYIRYDE
jgi:4a-hydroxytetrahydrobiopterin dehydratase